LLNDKKSRTNPAVLGVVGAAGIFIFMLIASMGVGPAGRWEYEWTVKQDGEPYHVEARMYTDPEAFESLWFEAEVRYVGRGEEVSEAGEVDQLWLHSERLTVHSDAGMEERASPGGPWAVEYDAWYGEPIGIVYQAAPMQNKAPATDGSGLVYYPVVDKQYAPKIRLVEIFCQDLGNEISRIKVTIHPKKGKFLEKNMADGWIKSGEGQGG